MYVDTSTVKTESGTYTRHLLRESYREDGKVKHRTIANLSSCTSEEIKAIKLALSHKNELGNLVNVKETISLKQGLSVGAVLLLQGIAYDAGLIKALGNSNDGKLALWQVLSRIIEQGSRLSAVRLASHHAACDILNLENFNEDDLYSNLHWLSEQQEKIENALYRMKYSGEKKPELFLYDVTSSYFEGKHNELSAYGYNRDGKKGKKQIVIGLLCDEEGDPLSVEVFHGNTSDPKTVENQIKKISERFEGAEITLVGDRGMLKSKEIESLLENKYHYITAITKPQIEALLNNDIIQMSLFDDKLAEVIDNDNTRYVLRRNPIRATEMESSRTSKYEKILAIVEKANNYLKEHPKASADKASEKIRKNCEKLKISKWIKTENIDREIKIIKDEQLLVEEKKFDGCYVLKTDLSKDKIKKEIIHDRYKDLAKVERAFRTQKTAHLELRPIHVRKEKSTRGHVFVVMLAYKLIRILNKIWGDKEITVEEGIQALTSLTSIEVKIQGKSFYQIIPEPRENLKNIIESSGIIFPKTINAKNIIVSTKKKLVQQRKST